MPMALTEKKLKQLSGRSRKKTERVWDTGGLHASVSPKGTISFAVKYRTKGQQVREGLGKWPTVSLDEARRRVHAIRARLDRKLEPPSRLESQVRTFKDAAENWMRDAEKSRDERTMAQIRRYLDACIESFGHMALKDVRPSHVYEAMLTFHDRGATESAKRARTYCSMVFRRCVRLGLCEMDPSATLKDKDVLGKPPIRMHHAAMPAEKIPDFLRRLAAANLHPSIRAALRFLVLTAMRTSEVLELRWEDVAAGDVSVTIPAERMKARKPHTVFLSKQARDVLNEARKFSEGREYVFPGRDANAPLSNMSLLMPMTRKGSGNTAGGLAPDYTVHGFRSSFSTWAHADGADPEVVERCLAHEPKNKVAAAYNRHGYGKEQSTLWQKWADAIAPTKGGAR